MLSGLAVEPGPRPLECYLSWEKPSPDFHFHLKEIEIVVLNLSSIQLNLQR